MSSIPIPSKGDIVTIENKQYRVLKVSGTVVEVLAMYDAGTQAVNETSKTVIFTGGKSGQQYKDSDLDTYLNETFFATLSATMQGAIVPKDINQDMWDYDASSSTTIGTYYNQKYGSNNRYYYDSNYGTAEVGSRNVYVLSIRDVIDYLNVPANGVFTDTDIWQMFWNDNTKHSGQILWLRSAYRYDETFVFYVIGDVGYMDSYLCSRPYRVRPVFQIDWDILYPSAPTLNFKHFFDAGTIGSGTYKFRHYSQTEPLLQLATPQNVTSNGTTVSWGAVENATSYEILVSGSSFGTVSTTSVDLSTLSEWASLTDGTYNIAIVAKADGYSDSEPSAAVSVTKSSVKFVQIFPTTTSDNYTLFDNLNQSKVYTTLIKDYPYVKTLKYSGGEWHASGVTIISQTSNSVKAIVINQGDAYFNSYYEGKTLEGNEEATITDFDGFDWHAVYANWACLVEGTKITLSDGSTKPVQDIQYGDNVLCYDFYTGKQTTSYIDWMIPERIATRYWEITLSDGTILNLVGSNGKSHRLYNVTKQRFDYPQDFEPNDITLKEDGTTAYILSCREIEKEVRYYNIASHEHINVYANGVLTSNRLNNRFKIVDNKFTDEKVMADKEVADYIDHLNSIRAK